MIISELIEALKKIKREKGDLEVICTRYSDYGPMTTDEVTVVKAMIVKGSGNEWFRRFNADAPEAASAKEYCHFDGN